MSLNPAVLDLGRALAALPQAQRALTGGGLVDVALPETDGIVLTLRAVEALLAEVYRNNTTAEERAQVRATLAVPARAFWARSLRDPSPRLVAAEQREA